jgi:hypothetical protein
MDVKVKVSSIDVFSIVCNARRINRQRVNE